MSPCDPELVGEAQQEVEAGQLGRAPQGAVAQIDRAQFVRVGQRVGLTDYHVDGFQAYELLGEAAVAAAGQRVPYAPITRRGRRRVR